MTAPSTDVRLVRARQAAVAHLRRGRRGGARRCASGCAGCRTWSGRCRGWRWGAAGRAISRRCATGSAQARRLRDGAGGRACRRCWRAAREALAGHEALTGLLEAALVAEPPLLARDGGFVAEGFDAELDETRRLRDQGRGVIAELQAEYVRRSGVGALKVKHNNVLGYFIETPAGHAERMMAPPLAELFVHRQTTAGAVRFTTLALAELETRILNAAGHALEIEKADLRAAARRGPRRRPGRSGRRRGRWPRSTWRAGSRIWRGARTGCGRRWARGGRSGSSAGGIRWWSRRCGGRAGASSPTTASSGGAGRGRSGWSPGRTWRGSRPICGRTR